MTSATTAKTDASRHRWKVLLSLIAMTVALVAAVASTDENEPTKVDDGGSDNGEEAAGGDGGDPESSDGPEEFQVGDTVELGDWRVTVHGFTDPLEGNEFLSPAEGHRWVAVDVEVTNVGDKAEIVSSLLCFELQDSRNIVYTQTITGSTDAATPDGEVPAAGSRRGNIEYEVPDDADGLRVNFACDLFSSGTATIALT